ncbi:MAG: hypothetical protein WC495_03790 [Patescibacteria group bacterium]
MAHTVTTQQIHYGNKFVVIKVNIKGDATDASELTKAVLFDASTYGSKTKEKLFNISYSLNEFSAELFWDAATDVALISLAKSRPYHMCYVELGGLRNNSGTGRTGDILISTLGLASTARDGHIVLRISWEE